MKDRLLTVKKRERVKWNGHLKMVQLNKNIMKEILKIINLKDLVYINGQMVKNMKVNGKRVKEMVMVYIKD